MNERAIRKVIKKLENRGLSTLADELYEAIEEGSEDEEAPDSESDDEGDEEDDGETNSDDSDDDDDSKDSRKGGSGKGLSRSSKSIILNSLAKHRKELGSMDD